MNVGIDDGALFGVLDVETTGLSPLVGDRIIEIALIRVGPDGTATDEYATLVNPERDVEQSHVHGITQEDVEAAPTFHEIVGDILERLEDVIVVAHNVSYDREFLSAELTSEGVFLSALPCLCTLKLSYRLHPGFSSHKLSACCEAAGVAEPGFHSALEDAKVTAKLLMFYMQEAGKRGMTLEELLGGALVFPSPWPSIPPSGRVLARSPQSQARLDPPYLARLVATLKPMESDETVGPYLDLLDHALEDRRVTSEEAAALEATATAWGLTREQVFQAHYRYLDALVATALADGIVTGAERRDLLDVSRLLGIPSGTLDAMISEADSATRSTIPASG